MADSRHRRAVWPRAVLGHPGFWNGAVLVLAWSLYPLVFTLSHNWFTLTAAQIGFLFLTIPAAAWLAYCSVSLLIVAMARLRPGRKGRRVDPFALGAVLVITTTWFLFLNATLLAIFDKDLWVVLVLAVLGGLLYLFLVKAWLLPLRLASLALLAAAGGEWTYNVAAEGGAVAKASAIARETGLRVAGRDLSFRVRPNIYLIIYDGYGNSSALRTIYGIENEETYSFLRDRGFVVKEEAFTNYRITWPTLLALFLANHHYYAISVGNDDTSVGRMILNGTALNPVFSVLQENGYRIQSINRGHFFGGAQGEIDYHFPPDSLMSAYDVFDSRRLRFLRAKLDERSERWARQRAALDRRIELAARDTAPWFTMTYIYKPGHADRDGEWRRLGDFEETYRRAFREANRHLRHIVQKIQSEDPEAFIILMGDHGGWRFINAWQAEGVTDANAAFEINGIPAETVTLDVFGILLAIGSGGRCDDQVYDALTPVNLMRVIFSCLSGQDLLADRPPDHAYFGDRFGGSFLNYLTVRDGRALERWEPQDHAPPGRWTLGDAGATPPRAPASSALATGQALSASRTRAGVNGM